jgi:hypothetical protein
MSGTSGPRITANLSGSIHQQLNMYAIAATAAGVGALALVTPAEAKIVYTRVNQPLIGATPLDLNNDGIPDFKFCIYTNSSSGSCSRIQARMGRGPGLKHRPGPIEELFVLPAATGSKRNRIWANAQMSAYALPAGVNVGGKQNFTPGAKFMAGCVAATTSSCGGAWYNTSHRYLALKVVISGAIHYGWARLTVKGCCSATLTGYAYETIANKPIITGNIVGDSKGEDEIESHIEQRNPASLNTPTPEPATLGLLALGSPGLSIWRREESVSALR